MFHDPHFGAKFLSGLGKIDEAYAAEVRKGGCPHCGGPLDRANFVRKPRGDLGEASEAYSFRLSFCCRIDGCRRRATPPSLRFLGRKVYVAVVVVVASVAGRGAQLKGRGRSARIHDVPVRTVRRWLGWWETVFAVGAFFSEAKAFFAAPVEVAALPASLLARFGGLEADALEKMLRFTAPVTTTSVRSRIAMAV